MNQKLFLVLLTFSLFIACKKDKPENKVPIANAGPSQVITLPTSTMTLAGTGTDPDGQIVGYLWSQVSGPGSSNIVNPSSPSTSVNDLLEGTYVFQLMVTDDKGATGVDTTSLIVNPSPERTLTVQPANNPNELQYLNWNGADQSGTGRPDIPVEAWTNGGTPYTIREALKFDLSSIPSTATIISANLYLYSYPNPTLNGNLVDANFGTDNSMLVQQIVSDWSPATSTWFNFPATNTANQIVVASTSQSNLDLNLDVKSMVSSMVSSNANYGFLLKIQNEVTYNSRIFVSSNNTTYLDKRPKLVVVYQ